MLGSWSGRLCPAVCAHHILKRQFPKAITCIQIVYVKWYGRKVQRKSKRDTRCVNSKRKVVARTVSEETPFRNTRYTKAHHTPAREQPPQGRDEGRATSGQLSRAVVARPRKSRGEGRRFHCNYHWCCCSSRHPHRGCFRAPASQRFRKEEGRGANRRFLRQGHGVEERPALGSRGAGIPFGIRTDGLRVVRRQIHGKILSGGGVGRPVHSFSKHA